MSAAACAIKDPLVWIDLEMTGLDEATDVILEIACIITDGDLHTVAHGPNIVVRHDEATLCRMNDWCTRTHRESGLWQRVVTSSTSMAEAEAAVLAFVRAHVPMPGVALLAGNSIHVDRRFLAACMPSLLAHLHYRLVDVSTVKELCRRWYADVFEAAPKKALCHRALDDIEESIAELRFYRRHIFIRPSP